MISRLIGRMGLPKGARILETGCGTGGNLAMLSEFGTVDAVENDAIKLTKSDSMDDMHHFLSLDDVEKIDDNRVYLKEGARIPSGLDTKATVDA